MRLMGFGAATIPGAGIVFSLFAVSGMERRDGGGAGVGTRTELEGEGMAEALGMERTP